MNIHNINNSKLDQFKGYVLIDTKKLDMKKSIIRDGIYYQPTNTNHILLPKEKEVIYEKVIYYRDYQSTFNSNRNDDIQSDLTLNINSISKGNQKDSNSSNDASSEETHSCNQNKYNTIIKDLIDNDSQNDIDHMIQDTYSISSTNNEEIEINPINNSDTSFTFLQESIIFLN